VSVSCICIIVQIAELSRADFVVEYTTNKRDAARAVQRALLAYRELFKGPVLVAVQAPQAAVQLLREAPILGDLPCVDVPPLAEDCRWVH